MLSRLCTIGDLGLLSGWSRAFAARAAVVYKWTDADGVVHFSDQAVPGAEKIIIASRLRPMAAAAPTHATQRRPRRRSRKPALDYKAFADLSRRGQGTVFSGDEIVPVRLRWIRQLKPDQEITWNLNGSPLATRHRRHELHIAGHGARHAT